MTPRSSRCGPRWSRVPRRTGSRPIYGPWSGSGWWFERVSGVKLARASVWRLLTGRLGWSLQRPQRRAVERDESEIARCIAHEWPRIKRGR
ncbi:winged helix-turn-helix domain-containing protein [Streptomyces rhizosphaericus]|uniref:winged helix-turn-helix domain-containing protein n=1 Tax=Streptomyces rhizosphaericus TaxID=114699 RepID=UPI0023EBCE29|nr:winged helix-turn-helix domain-containing protein [Streptomyces rhizosphaericus]